MLTTKFGSLLSVSLLLLNTSACGNEDSSVAGASESGETGNDDAPAQVDDSGDSDDSAADSDNSDADSDNSASDSDNSDSNNDSSADTNNSDSSADNGQEDGQTSADSNGDDSSNDSSAEDSGADMGETGGGDEGAAACQTWVIEYDLSGTTFEIDETAADKTVTVEEPYDGRDTIGPGTMTLRFDNVAGEPSNAVAVTDYQLDMKFFAGSENVAWVENNLHASSGPDECGKAHGILKDVDGTASVTWEPATLHDYAVKGWLKCTGLGCIFAGLPDGEQVDQDLLHDQELNDFVFGDETLSKFEMSKVEVPNEQDGKTYIRFVGTEVSRELVDSPDCACE